MAFSPIPALTVGVALTLFWIWLIATGRIKSLPPVLTAYAAFLALSFAAITWGRASFGDLGALLSRYRHYSEALVLISVVALFRQVPRRYGRRLMWALLPVSVAWLVFSCRHELAELEAYFIDHRIRLDYYAAEGHSRPNDPVPQSFRDFTLRNAHRLGVYDPAPIANKPRTFIAESRMLDAAGPPAMTIDPPIVGKKAMIVYGKALGHEHDGVIWLENKDTKYRGNLGTLPPATQAVGKRTGFVWGVYSLAGVVPGRYRIGIGIDDPDRPTVIWSVYSIDVE